MNARQWPWVAMVCLLVGVSSEADVLHVKHDASGANDGSSWSNAFRSLQAAITVASVSDQVWIAEGTYRPTSWPNGGSDQREKHFSLKEGVSVYGGFSGHEASLDERNSDARPVVLSGDLLGNDADSDGDGFSDATTTTDNVFHVFYHPASRPLTAATLLDSVEISGGCGWSDAAQSNGFFGAGIFNDGASPIIRRCHFYNNSAEQGGALYSSNNVCPWLEDCDFDHNSAENGGAICAPPTPWGPGVQAMIRCSFSSNRAAVGAAYHDDFGGTRILVASNCLFASNWSDYGPAVFAGGTFGKIINCAFSMNTNGALYVGGGGLISNCVFIQNIGPWCSAVYGNDYFNATEDPLKLINCTFSSNSAIAFYMERGAFDLRDSLFEHNDGSAVHAGSSESRKEFVVSNCVFRGNHSGSDGGGLVSYEGGLFCFQNCFFQSNSAPLNGGAIYVANSDIMLQGCSFLGNVAGAMGGAIHSEGGFFAANGSDFRLNSARGNLGGGAICSLWSTDFMVSNCVFSSNSASPDAHGGAVYLAGTSNAFVSSAFHLNNTDGLGGAVSSYRGATLFDRCSFASNSSAYSGGAIVFWENSQDSISNCTFFGNWVTGLGDWSFKDGGAVCGGPDFGGVYMTFCNSTFSGNHTVSNGGAIAVGTNNSARIVHCTIADNSAANGGGVSGAAGASAFVSSSILWGNTPNQLDFPNAIATHCVIQGGYAGDLIYDSDPLLNPIGFYGGSTLTRPIGLGSPARHAGLEGPDAPTHDQRGFGRYVLPDIGSCEFQAFRLVSDVSNPATIGSLFTFHAISDINGALFQWFTRESGDAWDPIDGGTNGLFATLPLDLGLDLWVRVTGQGTNVNSAVQSIEVRGTYPEWVAFHGLTGSDADTGASPGSDGIPNLIKYASGLDPNANCSRGDYESLHHDGTSNKFSLVWCQSKTPTDLSWSFRKSTNLLDWVSIGGSTNRIQSGTGYDLWETTVPADDPRLFFDVKVDLISP